MEITLNFEKVVDKDTLFEKLSEDLITENWGHNWDALNDCLRDMDSGGFTKKYNFPLTIKFTNWKQFLAKSPDQFKTFQEVLHQQVQEHKNYDKELIVSFEESNTCFTK